MPEALELPRGSENYIIKSQNRRVWGNIRVGPTIKT